MKVTKTDGFLSTSCVSQKSHPTLSHKNHMANSRRRYDRVFATNSGTLVLEVDDKVRNAKRKKAEFDLKEMNRDVESLKRQEERIARMLEKAKDGKKFNKSCVEDVKGKHVYARKQEDIHVNVAPMSSITGKVEKESEGRYSVEVDKFGIAHLVEKPTIIKDVNKALKFNNDRLKDIMPKSTLLAKAEAAEEKADVENPNFNPNLAKRRKGLESRLSQEKEPIQEKNKIFESNIDSMPGQRVKNMSLFASHTKPWRKVPWTAMILISLMISVSKNENVETLVSKQ